MKVLFFVFCLVISACAVSHKKAALSDQKLLREVAVNRDSGLVGQYVFVERKLDLSDVDLSGPLHGWVNFVHNAPIVGEQIASGSSYCQVKGEHLDESKLNIGWYPILNVGWYPILNVGWYPIYGVTEKGILFYHLGAVFHIHCGERKADGEFSPNHFTIDRLRSHLGEYMHIVEEKPDK